MVPTAKNAVTNQIRDNLNVTNGIKIRANIDYTASEIENNLRVVETVATRLGYATLKIKQRDLFLVGRDVFVVLPTGYGKTMCYSCLPC